MHILNVKVCVEDEFIKIYFDSLDIGKKVLKPNITIHETMMSKFYYTYPELVDNALNRIVKIPTKFYANFENAITLGYKVTSIYQLPIDPNLALDFFAAFHTLLKHYQYDYILFNHFSIDEQLVNTSHDSYPIQTELMITIEELLGTSKLFFTVANFQAIANVVRSVPTVTMSFLASSINYLRGIPEEKPGKILQAEIATKEMIALVQEIMPVSKYGSLHAVLSKLQRWCKAKSNKISDALEIKQRFAILMSISLDNKMLTHSADNIDLNVKFYYALLRKFLSQDNKNALSHFIDNMNLLSKRRLFENCLGKKAKDNRLYTWRHSEWLFLRHAEFRVKHDGCLSIKVKDNKGYQQNYAPSMKEHDVFENNIRHMGSILKLEFEKDINFHEEIIFTPACSKTLMANGLHFNRTYLEKLLKVKLIGGVFHQAHEHGIHVKQNEKITSTHYLPKDIFDLIMGELFKAMDPFVYELDAKAAKNIGWDGTVDVCMKMLEQGDEERHERGMRM